MKIQKKNSEEGKKLLLQCYLMKLSILLLFVLLQVATDHVTLS